MATATYPVRVNANLDPGVSRWLWLVKWLLVIPHYIVLAFLWVAFVVLSFLAFFAILFTGHYPRSMFDFNVGVLRWTWRVSYYTYGTLGTDRYPPFTLAEVPDYPAHFEVAYPEHLSRGLVLVKWWLLAIPHYVVIGFFVGGGVWAAWRYDSRFGVFPGGLIGILVFVAAIVLAVTGRYPQQIFDFVLGMNRWVLRVAAYAALMTDDYPPFRLDMGGSEPAASVTLPPAGSALASATAPPDAPPTKKTGPGWTGGRIVSLVIGAVLALISLLLLAGGGIATWLTASQRDSSGYLTTNSHAFTATSYALTSERIDLGTGADWATVSDILGTVRIRATASNAATPVFIGIAPQSAVDTYLAGVSHTEVTNWADGNATTRQQGGGAPHTAPVASRIWTARAVGLGRQTLTWHPTGGAWAVVVMNPSGRPGVSVIADVGATIPDLKWFAVGLFVAGGVLLCVAVPLIAVPIARAGR
ncbi:MAG TPA: DUF4389 domain-containing protein [Jatrophihabitans sp.]|jgi:hypothetical protein